jgi:aldehyde:ferredoxin oxidoreductase
MHGWMGRILRVDLSDSRVDEIETQPYAEKYLGGRGLASRLYWEKVGPDVGAFDPGNRLVFMTGPLLATGVQGSARMAVCGKSPMAYPERYCYGNMGGFFGAELKKAGWDGIVIDGKSPRPVYIVINDGEVEIRDAAWLWGQSACRVEEMLLEKHGDKARFATTGVAGENLVRSAIIYGSQQASVTGGFGAVMGAKNLKAIVVRGTGPNPTVADPAGLKELNRYTLSIKNTVSLAVTPRLGGTNHGHIVETFGQRHCYQCGLVCSKLIYRFAGDPALQGLRGCQAMEYYLPWTFGRPDEPYKTLFDAPTLANDYSIGTFELQYMVDWLYACYRAGVLTEAETGLPLAEIGTRHFLETLLHAIAYREGFGDILGEGMVRVRSLVSPEAAALIPRATAPIGQHDAVPPRSFIAHGLLYAMENRYHPISVHEMAYVRLAWSMNQADPASSPVSPEVLCKISRAFWGSEAAADQTTYEGKALAAKKTQDRTYLKDSLALCDFVWPITYSLTTPDHVGDAALMGRLFTAVTGIDAAVLDTIAERIFNVQRYIFAREGLRIPQDDYPPEFNFTLPLQSPMPGGRVMAPGPGGRAADLTGNVLDRVKYAAMLKEYYRLRGWDEKTGLPTPETAARLGIDDMATPSAPAASSAGA